MEFSIYDTFTNGSGQKFTNEDEFITEIKAMIKDCYLNGGTYFSINVDTDASCFNEENKI